MGSSHSDTSSGSSSASSSSSSMPSNPNCCLVPRSGFKRLLQKLRRTLKRHFRVRKTRCGGFQRRYGARTALLRPMPRCSSFGSCGTLLTPTKRGNADKKPTPLDTHYAQWKCMFEHTSASSQLKKRSFVGAATVASQRPHNISEALSGQTTPRGFPSHTDTRRCSLQLEVQRLQPVVEQQPTPAPVYEQKVRRRLSFRLPLSSSSGSSSSSGFASGSSRGSSVRRMTARQRAAQAKHDAQLQRELRDLEDYYGGFHYARRNERRI